MDFLDIISIIYYHIVRLVKRITIFRRWRKEYIVSAILFSVLIMLPCVTILVNIIAWGSEVNYWDHRVTFIYKVLVLLPFLFFAYSDSKGEMYQILENNSRNEKHSEIKDIIVLVAMIILPIAAFVLGHVFMHFGR